MLALWWSGGGAASADTLTPAAYLSRLRDARALLASGRVEPARELLARTSSITVAGGTVRIDDAPFAATLAAGDAARLDAYIAFVQREQARALDPARDDAAIREVTRDTAFTAGPQPWLAAFLAWLSQHLTGFTGSIPDVFVVVQIVGGLGLAALLLVIAILGRGLRERVRSEVLAREIALSAREDPQAHLAAADRAIAEGRARDAVHRLYLYALTSLAAREAIRYDPALTNRELLTRAAAIPHVDALRRLVALYERVWFGLREPGGDEAREARTLAMRVAG